MSPRICLLDGQHTPGSEWERECPVLNAPARSARALLAAATRRRRREAAAGTGSDVARRDIAVPQDQRSFDTALSNTSETVPRDGPVQVKVRACGT
jgi:hypothetical protein